jgi:hypothetical protein
MNSGNKTELKRKIKIKSEPSYIEDETIQETFEISEIKSEIEVESDSVKYQTGLNSESEFEEEGTSQEAEENDR